MRFTPVMFVLIGYTELLSPSCNGMMYLPPMVLLVMIGVLAVLRSESRLLPALIALYHAFAVFSQSKKLPLI